MNIFKHIQQTLPSFLSHVFNMTSFCDSNTFSNVQEVLAMGLKLGILLTKDISGKVLNVSISTWKSVSILEASDMDLKPSLKRSCFLYALLIMLEKIGQVDWSLVCDHGLVRVQLWIIMPYCNKVPVLVKMDLPVSLINLVNPNRKCFLYGWQTAMRRSTLPV